MIVEDEGLWREQCAALDSDETGREVRKFLEAWLDRAEGRINAVHPVGDVAEALRWALPLTQEDLEQRWSIGILGQMLVMITANWHYGKEMLSGLTSLEYAIFAESVLAKIESLVAESEAHDD